MKTCRYCGRENEDAAIVCRECGQSEFPETEQEEARAAQAEPPVTVEPQLPEPDVASGEEACICPFCLFPNVPGRQWCKNCGSPVEAPILDPFQGAVASGLMWRGAVRGRPKLIVLCLTWLLFFPLFVQNGASIFLRVRLAQNWPLFFCSLLLAPFYLFVPASFLYWVTRNFLKEPKLKLDD